MCFLKNDYLKDFCNEKERKENKRKR